MDDTFEIVNLGENKREPAEPADGENEREPAEPADDTADDTEETAAPEETGENEREPAEPAQGTAEQTTEERRKQAALRRERENAALEAEKRAAQARIDAAYASAYEGKVNPYTGRPITTEAEYKAYQQEYERDQLNKQLERSGLSMEAFNSAVSNHPIVKQAQEAISAAKRAAQSAQAAAAKEGVAAELKRITAIDPAVKTLDDLSKMSNAPEYFDLVKRGGLSLSEAYKLINFERLTARRTAAAKQAAINSAAGKAHLSATASHGSGGVDVPRETMEMYREVFPDMTDEEFRKHYAAHNTAK